MAPTGSSALAAAITSVLTSTTTTSPTSTTDSPTTTSSSPTATSSADSEAAGAAANHKRILYIALFNPGALLVYCAVLYFGLKWIKYCLIVRPRRHRVRRNPAQLRQEQQQPSWADICPPQPPIRAHDGVDPDKAQVGAPIPMIGMVGDETTKKTRGLIGWGQWHQPTEHDAPGCIEGRPRTGTDTFLPLHTIVPNGPAPRESASTDKRNSGSETDGEKRDGRVRESDL